MDPIPQDLVRALGAVEPDPGSVVGVDLVPLDHTGRAIRLQAARFPAGVEALGVVVVDPVVGH